VSTEPDSGSASRVAGRGLTDDAAAEAFTRWLGAALGVSGVTLGSSEAPPFNGASNDTLVVQASWTGGSTGSGSGGFVIRRPPTGASLYQHYDLASQYATMAALADSDIPVPPLVGYEPDASVLGSPFYVMGEVVGQAPPDLPPYTQVGWLLPLSVAEQAQLYEASIEMLARVHRLDAASLALSHLPGGTDGGGLSAQLASVESWYRWAVTCVANPVLDATLGWLLANRPAPSASLPEGLNWGDARIGNMMYRDLTPVAVLDWEMAAIGPAEVDLGWWLFLYRFHTEGMGAAPLPGFPDEATTVAMWEAAVGRPAHDVHYYQVLAGFRFGIIVLRAARKMVDAGELAPEQSYERVNGATLILADLLGLPTPV
jgi:aminoglycoside phosphotransferase (APT) family kinase protein